MRQINIFTLMVAIAGLVRANILIDIGDRSTADASNGWNTVTHGVYPVVDDTGAFLSGVSIDADLHLLPGKSLAAGVTHPDSGTYYPEFAAGDRCGVNYGKTASLLPVITLTGLTKGSYNIYIYSQETLNIKFNSSVVSVTTGTGASLSTSWTDATVTSNEQHFGKLLAISPEGGTIQLKLSCTNSDSNAQAVWNVIEIVPVAAPVPAPLSLIVGTYGFFFVAWPCRRRMK